MQSNQKKFDFNDILIIPKAHSNITSRYNDIELPKMLPLFTAPMDTVVNLKNKNIFIDNKINVILPRTITYDQFKSEETLIFFNGDPVETDDNYDDLGTFISLGFDEINYYHNTFNFDNFHRNAHIHIDTANGHMDKIVEYAKLIKFHRPDIIIMVGNIANPETYYWYAKQNCVDYIKIGIGAGSACTTSVNGSIGYPMASLINETYIIKQDFISFNEIKPPAIVADGGMKNYSDVIKALALGADYVALGSIFNKAIESCGNNYLYGIKINKTLANYLFDNGYPVKKYFRGMSTKEAQKAMGKANIKTSEGVIRYREVEYHLSGWVENFEHYLRTAMSYAGARTLDDFIGNVDFCQITKNSYDRFNK